MAALGPEEKPGWDDGPSRPGIRLRRTIVVVISGLVIVFTPVFVLWLWALAHPGPGPFNLVSPSGPVDSPKKITSTMTIQLTIARSDWSRFVQATDKFAAKHGLVDSQSPSSLIPVSELQRSWVGYESKEADLTIERMVQADAPTTDIRIKIHEVGGSGAGERLKAAFESEVIRAEGFN